MEVEWLANISAERRRHLTDRATPITSIADDVSEIIEQVRADGDEALFTFAKQFDDVDVTKLELTDELTPAYQQLTPSLRKALDTAVENVRQFHEQQRREDWWISDNGIDLGRRFSPIKRIGAYVPGGTAAYPSSAIMTVVPARVAGVEEIVVTTPPGDPVPDLTLAALHAAGATEVYQAGGAQAISALAYGTESINSVHKIVGPGNRWVTAAKAAVSGKVAIDFLAGPSEILVIADESANPAYVAADLLAQAEHDPNSPCMLVTETPDLANEIATKIESLLADTPREPIAREALAQETSGLFLVDEIQEAVAFAEEVAPEHLSIQTVDDESILDQIHNAGSIFLGPYTPVAAGDYASGTNHVLPTGGATKVTGGLSVDSFLRSSTVQRLSSDGLATLAPTIEQLATAEGLIAHADSVTIRSDPDSGSQS